VLFHQPVLSEECDLALAFGGQAKDQSVTRMAGAIRCCAFWITFSEQVSDMESFSLTFARVFGTCAYRKSDLRAGVPAHNAGKSGARSTVGLEQGRNRKIFAADGGSDGHVVSTRENWHSIPERNSGEDSYV
jgi:hypothetical protein